MSEPVPLDRACILGHGEPVEREFGYACKRHYGWILDTLREIESLAPLMGETLRPGASGQGRGGTQVHSPAPGRIDIMAITDKRNRPINLPLTPERNLVPSTGTLESNGEDEIDIIAEVLGWCQIVIEELPKARGYGLVMLRSERKWISQQPWLDDYAESLGKVHRALSRAVGETLWPRPVGKCPNCGASLYNTIGLDEIHCRRCRSTWAGTHLARLRLIFEQEAR